METLFQIKKLFFLFVIAAVVASTVMAAGTQEPGVKAASKSGEVVVNAPGSFPIVDEKVDLKVWSSPPSWIGDLSENWFTKYFEDKTNVHVNWIRANLEEHWEKINIVLASQSDLPDVFLSWGIQNAQLITYGSQGVFLPLNDLIEKYGVATKEVFAYNDEIEQRSTAPDGNIYGLPAINECYHCTYNRKMWINQTWLDNLGLDMPTTTDEFYNVLKAFKQEDANGNGDKNDEVPLARNTWSGNIDYFIMNAFIYNAAWNRLYLDDDTIIQAAIQPEWREGLGYMKKLYQEGLMHPEIFLLDDNKTKILTAAENGNRVGACAGGTLSFVDHTTPVKEEYVALAPLEGPNGLRVTYKGPLGMGQGNFVITNRCEYPEVAFRFGDAIYQMYLDEDWNIMGGPEGEVWRKAKLGEVGLDGKPAKYAIVKSAYEPNNFTWNDGINTFLSARVRNSMVATPGEWNHEKVLYDATKEKYEPYAPDLVMPVFFMPLDLAEEWNELNVTIPEYIEESIAKFVTSARDLDTEWDSYVTELKKMGYDRLRDLAQEVYDNQYK